MFVSFVAVNFIFSIVFVVYYLATPSRGMAEAIEGAAAEVRAWAGQSLKAANAGDAAKYHSLGAEAWCA